MAKKTNIEPKWEEPVCEPSMWEKINSDFYKSKLPYPTKPKKPAEPVLVGKTPKDYRNHAAALESYASNELAKYAEEVAAYDVAMSEYRTEGSRLDEMFWKDAIADNFSDEFTKNFPTTVSKMRYKAYEDGHSSGYSEIYNHLINLSEIASAIMEDVKNQK